MIAAGIGPDIDNLKIDFDFKFFQLNLFTFRDRGNGKCDSTAQRTQKQFDRAAVFSVFS
jgi:hypothetical protein